MLEMLQQRIKMLEINYRKYFDTDTGPSKSKSGAACMRSRIKVDDPPKIDGRYTE